MGLLGLATVQVCSRARTANDVSKGIATLVGSGVTSYRRAILWGTVLSTVRMMAVAWVVTIPVAALLGAMAYSLAILGLA
jgi:phosphate/sulfate permease